MFDQAIFYFTLLNKISRENQQTNRNSVPEKMFQDEKKELW